MGLVPATCKNSENNTPEKMGSQGNPPTFSFIYLQVIIGLPTISQEIGLETFS